VTNPLPQLEALTAQHTALLAELEGLKEGHQYLEGELEAVRAERDAARAVAAANLATSMKVYAKNIISYCLCSSEVYRWQPPTWLQV
jgi:hypothetical protein